VEVIKLNVKKNIKGIVGIGVVGGIANLAYKIGECNGEMNERVHAMADVGDDDYNFSDYDEPCNGCIAPADSAEK
jgi:hypothetical protein